MSTAQTEEMRHVHVWGPSYNLVESKCKCGSIKISEAESQHRMEEWNSYFKLVKHSKSYNNFKWFQALYRQRNLPRMQWLRTKIKARLEKDDYLPKPSFPDPTTWNRYVVGGEL